jgi:hypothetical protein
MLRHTYSSALLRNAAARVCEMLNNQHFAAARVIATLGQDSRASDEIFASPMKPTKPAEKPCFAERIQDPTRLEVSKKLARWQP